MSELKSEVMGGGNPDFHHNPNNQTPNLIPTLTLTLTLTGNMAVRTMALIAAGLMMVEGFMALTSLLVRVRVRVKKGRVEGYG